MPFALLIIGLVLLISAAKDTQGSLFTLLTGDFTGANNFVYWFVSILILGSIGYIPKLKPLSTALLVLVVLVLVLTKGRADGVGGGLFTQFSKQLASTVTPNTSSNTTNSTQPSTIKNNNIDFGTALSALSGFNL